MTISKHRFVRGNAPAPRKPRKDGSMHPKVQERLQYVPPQYQRQYLAAMRGKSLRSAVASFCRECVGWDRREVALCTAPACPLFPYRPYKQDQEESDD